MIPPVLIVSADSALYGTFEDAYEDVKKYVFSTIISPYTPQNMQAVLETLGNGGGNGATAGAQIKGKPLQEVLKELIAAIDAFYS